MAELGPNEVTNRIKIEPLAQQKLAESLNQKYGEDAVFINKVVINDIDFEFVHKLAAECPAKIIAEGHIHYPEQAVKALEAGAFALVVGGAITRPAEITARYTAAINNHK